MRNLTQENITQAVIARLAHTPDERLREVMTSLVHARPVHAHRGDEQRQATGVHGSDRVRAVPRRRGAPVPGRRRYPPTARWASRARVRGRVVARDGRQLANARVEVWQADASGNYDLQYEGLDRHRARGVLHAGPDGRFHFRTVLAESYPIPADGPMGALLRATARHPWRPAHLHFMIEAEGYEKLVTHVFRSGDPYLDSDAVFGVRESLVADWVRQTDGSYLLDYEFVLNPLPSPTR